MAWNDESRIFRSFLHDALGGVTVNLSELTANVALFDNAVEPDHNADSADAAYGAGTWLADNERTDEELWPAGGLALPGTTWTTPSDGTLLLGAGNVVSPEGTSLDDVHGDLVYLDGSSQGIAYHAFGGAQAVTNGTFSIRFADEGVLRLTV